MRVFFPEPLKFSLGSVFCGRTWFFVKDHTIWFVWIEHVVPDEDTWTKTDYLDHEYEQKGTLYRQLARAGKSGKSYEEVLNLVLEKEPENPLKGKFVKLLQRKIKERDKAKAQQVPPKS